MKKYIYILVSAFIILVVIAIKFPSLTGSLNAVNAKIEEPEEVKYSKEIQEVLSKFDSLFNVNIQESGAIGGAVVIIRSFQYRFNLWSKNNFACFFRKK